MMRLFSTYQLFGLLVILMLALSACAGNTTNINDQTTPFPEEGATPIPEPDDAAVPTETPLAEDAEQTPVVIEEEDPAEIPETGPDSDVNGQAVIDSASMVFVSNVIGTTVANMQGEPVGEITDLAYDNHSGTIVYVILSPQGEADAALRNQMAFPWGLLASDKALEDQSVETEGESVGSVPAHFVFTGDEQVLLNSPSLATDELADEKFNLWSEELYYYWREAFPELHIVGVSDITVLDKVSGLDHIQVMRGETGETHQARDIVVDLSTGNMLYVVVEADDLMPGEQGLLLIPHENISYGSLEDGTVGFVFHLSEEVLQNFPRIQEGDIPTR
jgi:sporulation protein YlmC with PRC-barrel domain